MAKVRVYVDIETDDPHKVVRLADILSDATALMSSNRGEIAWYETEDRRFMRRLISASNKHIKTDRFVLMEDGKIKRLLNG